MAILSASGLLPRLHFVSASYSIRAVAGVLPWRTFSHVNAISLVVADRWTWLGRFSQDQSFLTHESAAICSVETSGECGFGPALSSAGSCGSQLHPPELSAQAAHAAGVLRLTRQPRGVKVNKRRRDYPRVPGFTSAVIAVRGNRPRRSILPKALPGIF